MNGANLLDNLQIPVESTPNIDVTRAPTASPMTPKSQEKEIEAKKQDFMKKHSDVLLKESEVAPTPKFSFNFNFGPTKEYLLNFIIPIVGTLISLLLLILFIIPSINHRAELKAEIQQKTNLKNLLNEKKNKLNNLSDLKSIFDENLEVVNRVLSSEENVPELLTEVDHLARSSGLEVDSLSYSLSASGVGSSSYSVVDISLTVNGTLDQFINFMRLTENASRLVLVSTFRYSESKDGKLTVSTVLKSPYQTVNSQAVTDDPIKLDINSTTFAKFITKIKSLTYYDPERLEPVEVVETQEPAEEETTEEQPQE